MPTRYLDVVRPKSRWAVWAWAPVIVLRFSLVATYVLYIYASVQAFLVGIPIFTLSTPPGYTPIWAVLLGTSALIAALGATSDEWQKIEKWATLVLSGMLFAYIVGLNTAAYAGGDLSRQFVGTIALIAAILPFTRFIYLIAQSGKKKYDAQNLFA